MLGLLLQAEHSFPNASNVYMFPIIPIPSHNSLIKAILKASRSFPYCVMHSIR